MAQNWTMNEVRKRYGGIGRSTVYRWMEDPKIGFPRPRKIGARILWTEDDLNAFDANTSSHLDG